MLTSLETRSLIVNGWVQLETQMDALEDVFAVADMRTNKSDAFFPVIFFSSAFLSILWRIKGKRGGK